MTIIFIIIGLGAGTAGIIYAVGLNSQIYHQTTMTNPNPTSLLVSDSDGKAADLKQKLLTKCTKLQKWYDDVDLHQDFKCTEYADAYSNLIK